MKTEVEVGIYCQEGPGSLEHQGGMCHGQGTMERYSARPVRRMYWETVARGEKGEKLFPHSLL